MAISDTIQSLVATLKSKFEDKTNKTSSWNSTTSDTRYPTEKLVKDSLDGKANSNHTHTKSNITDFPETMTPTSHTDSNGSYGKATTSVYGHTKLSSATNSNAEDVAATSKAVRTAYSLANTKLDEYPSQIYSVKGINVYNDDYDSHQHSILSDSIIFDNDEGTAHYIVNDGYVNSSNEIATRGEINGKENTSNKSSSVATDATSTTKYPNVKAVKDYVDDAVGGIVSGEVDIGQTHDHDDRYYTESEMDTKLAAKNVTVTKLNTATTGYIATYEVKQGTTSLGKIDIPKDYLVKSGSVKTVITTDKPVSGYAVGDKYIDFIINTKDSSGTDEHIYINVKDLVDTYIPESNGSNIQMNGTLSPGQLSTYARGDHVHPTDTSRAPTKHASTGTEYGVGTTANYGHNKIIDDVTKSSLTNGESLSAHMGYILNNQDIEYVVSTHTSSTSTWTGACSKLRKLEAGTKIYYRLNQDPTTTEVTLNLTLADNTTTGAKSVFFGGTRLKNQYPKYAVIGMVFDGSNWIVINQYATASTMVGEADTSAGSAGSSTAYARADHTHKQSSLYAPATHTHTDSQINFNGSGLISPIDAGLNQETSTNKIAFLPPNNLTVQYANSSTSTLTTYSVSDANKTKIMSASSIGGAPLVGGGGVGTISTSDKLVVTVDAGNITSSTASQVYIFLRKIHLYFGTGSCTGCQVKVETADYPTPTTWVNKGTYNLSGNPYWNAIPLNIPFGGYANQNIAGHVRYIKLTFTCTGTGNNSSRFALRNIQMFGITNWVTPSNLASIGHIYNYNENQDAIFPAKIIKSGGTSSQFLKADGSVDSNTYSTTSHTHNYLPTNANGTTTGTLTATKFINSSSNNTNILLGNGNTLAQSTFATSGHTHEYAPTSHASTATTYGVATTGNYGHTKVVQNLTTDDGNGLALGAGQGKWLYDNKQNKQDSWCGSIDATHWYLKPISFEIKGGYTDRPITFRLDSRRPNPIYVTIIFRNENSSDPQLAAFETTGGDNACYLYKEATSKWSLIVKKSELHDGLATNQLVNNNTNITITYPNQSLETLPTSNIQEARRIIQDVHSNLLDGTRTFTGSNYSNEGITSSLASYTHNGCTVRYFNGGQSQNVGFRWTIPTAQQELGGIYTLSFWARTDSNHSNAIAYFYQGVYTKRLKSNGTLSNSGEGNFGDGGTAFNLTNAWRRYYVTWQINSSGTLANKTLLIRLTTTSTAAAQNLIVCGVKFEKGPYATEYCESVVDGITDGTINGSTKIAQGSITTAKIADSAVTSAKIADGTIVNADIASNAAIATSKISGLDTTLNSKVSTSDSRLTDTRTPTFNKITANANSIKDLNTYRTGGFYYNESNAESKYIIHCPNSNGTSTPYDGNKAFFLLVETWGASNNSFVKQTLTYYDTNKTYTRTKTGNSDANSSWTAWTEISKDTNTTYTAGTGLSLSGTTFSLNHPNSGVTAGTHVNGAQTPGFGSTFNIPKITYNAQGHITAMGSSTVKIPALGTTASTAAAGNHTHTKWTTVATQTCGGVSFVPMYNDDLKIGFINLSGTCTVAANNEASVNAGNIFGGRNITITRTPIHSTGQIIASVTSINNVATLKINNKTNSTNVEVSGSMFFYFEK